MLNGMRADDFVVETISHFVRGVEGPPPVVPAHVDAQFETSLVSLCFQQQMSAVLSEALDELALPPSISRITIARIKNHAADLRSSAKKRMQLLGGVLAALEKANITAAVTGDAWSAALPGKIGELRPVDRLDLLISERRWTEAVAVMRGLGFARSRIQPRLTAPNGADEGTPGPTSPTAALEALFFHHYFSPLIMHDHSGDQVQLRFRVIDAGRPEPKEAAWDKVRQIIVDGRPALGLSTEDQLICSVVEYGTRGFVDLPLVMDIGFLARKFARTLDWGYITRRLRKTGFYPAFYFSLEHVCRLLHIGRVTDKLARPGGLRRRLFDLWWRLDEVDYSGEVEPTGGRFMYSLLECGGFLTKARWLHRALIPKTRWVKSVYGRPSNPWLRLKFLHDVRSGRRKRTGDRHSLDAVSRFTGYE